MAPLVIGGETLGQKHRNYNKVVNETTLDVIPDINYDEPDLDNLLRIDIACRDRDVDYVIRVLQCEDMLYVSRAIKRATWLITDPRYADIINPKYLYDEMSPKMMSKAFNKLLHQAILNTKDKKRAEDFFNYYREREMLAAFKWLPLCSIQFIEDFLQKHASEIPSGLVQRLGRISITCARHLHGATYFKREALESPTVFLNDNIDAYLDLVESSCEVPRYGPKVTKLLLKKRGERILKNLYHYASAVHVPTFARFIKLDEIENFVKMNIVDVFMRDLFEFGKVNYFVNRIPIARRYAFVKQLLAETKECDIHRYIVEYFCGERKGNWHNTNHLYTFATFEAAFTAMKDAIRSELNPKKKVSMFEILLACARKDVRNVHTLLKYYRDNHIKEPFKCQMQFANLVIRNTDTHKFDKETWGCLNDLLVSMDAYSEYVEIDQTCVQAIILYNAIHDESIPEAIEDKFDFDTFKASRQKLSADEKEKLFVYLFKYTLSKLNSFEVNDKIELREFVELLTNTLKLLFDWNKELRDFPVVLDHIKNISQINLDNNWNEDLSVVFSFKKSWRKLLLRESINLSLNQETCIDVLKYDPNLLKTYDSQVKSICLNGSKPTDRFLKIVRIYWPHSLANTYKNFFKNEIKQNNAHKAVIVGLCLLLPKNELVSLVTDYAPKEPIIDWRQPHSQEVALRKHIASSLHLARPQPSAAAVLLYAQGDYIHCTLPSLNAILCSLNSAQIRQLSMRLIDAPAFLQNHCLRIAFTKVKDDELKQLFNDIWNTNKSSIRATFLNQALDFLTREGVRSAVTNVWELLNVIIKNSTPEEAISIYTKLGKVEKLSKSMRPEFVMKSYKFLKSLPPNAKSNRLLGHIKNDLNNVIENLDSDFAAEVFLESFDEHFSTKRYEFKKFVVKFILSVQTEEEHMARYSKVFVPILERSFAMWNKTHEGTNYVKINLSKILSYLDSQLELVVLKPPIFFIPSLTDILKRICENLSIEENYVFITELELTLHCFKIINRMLQSDKKLASILWNTEEYIIRFLEYQNHNPMYTDMVPELSRLCLKHLKDDVLNYCPSIYQPFSRAFVNVIDKFYFNPIDTINILKSFLEDEDFIQGYLFVLESLPKYAYGSDEKALLTELFEELSAHPSVEVKTSVRLIKFE